MLVVGSTVALVRQSHPATIEGRTDYNAVIWRMNKQATAMAVAVYLTRISS